MRNHSKRIPSYLLLLLFSLFASCENDKKENNEAALALLLENQGEISGASSATCPTGSLPESVYLFDTVISSSEAEKSDGFKDSSRATNGICGSDNGAGSLDVYSLDQTGTGSTITLRITNRIVKNGDGLDFVVYENPFAYDGGVFMEPLIVEVSDNGMDYCGFHPDYLASDETVFSSDPDHWASFAGIHPVFLRQDGRTISEDLIFLDENEDHVPDEGGGDGFNLDNLSAENSFATGCSEEKKNTIQLQGFRYIRLTAATNRLNPDTTESFPSHSAADSGPDLDGVIARYTSIDPEAE